MLTILLFIDCSKMARIRINTRNHIKEKPYLVNSYFCQNWYGKKVNRVSKKTCMYVSEICGEGFFVNFRWWLKNVKSRSKIDLFSNERHFDIWFPKKKTITFSWSKLSGLHKKDPILHVTTTFSLKQGETRTSSGPIPHSLTPFFEKMMHASYKELSNELKSSIKS